MSTRTSGLRARDLALVTLLMLSAPPSRAQEPVVDQPTAAGTEPIAGTDAQPAPALVLEAETLMKSIAVLQAETELLRKQAEGETGEEQDLLFDRIHKRRSTLHDATKALTVNLAEQRRAGVEAAEHQARLEQSLRELATRSVERLAEQRTRLSARERMRAEVPTVQLREWEEHLVKEHARLDGQYIAVLDTLGAAIDAGVALGEVLGSYRAELQERAEERAARVERYVDQLAAAQRLAADATADKKAAAEDALLVAKAKLEGAIANLQTAADLMKQVGLENSSYQQLLISTTGRVTENILQRDVAVGLVSHWRAESEAWFRHNGPRAIFKILVFFGILAVSRLLARFAQNVAQRTLEGRLQNLSQLLRATITTWTYRLVMAIGFLFALSQVGVSLGPLLAGFGVAGLIIGLAMQDSLGNFAAGALILIYRPFDVGDVVESQTVRGAVRKMSMVNTTILTFDNQEVVIPNATLWGSVIRNFTSQANRRVDAEFSVARDTDIARMRDLLGGVIQTLEHALPEPEPVVVVSDLTSEAIVFAVRVWVPGDQYWPTKTALLEGAIPALQHAGIAAPKRALHLDRGPG